MVDSVVHALPPHYSHFLEAWSSEPHRNMAMLWPAGAGAVGALEVLVTGLDRSQRVLVVADRHELAQQLVYRLDSHGIPARVIDRYALRQLQSQTSAEHSTWNGLQVFALTDSLATQADVLASLGQQAWDLVLLLDTSSAVTELVVSGITNLRSRVLWKLRPGSDAARVDSGHWALDHLSIGGLLAASGLPESTVPPVAIHVTAVRPSAAEEAVSSLVGDLIEASKGTGAERLAMSLRARWMSSPAALESGLRRLESQLATDWPLWDLSVDEAEDESPSERPHPRGTDLTAIHRTISACLVALDGVESDSKLRGLVEQVRSRDAAEAIAIFVRYRDTGTYLYSSLEDFGVRCFLVHGALAPAEIDMRMNDFLQRSGGILVMTTAMLVGSDLRKVRNLVLYDPPASREVMAQVLAKFHVVGLPQLHVHVVSDQRATGWTIDLIEQAGRFVV
jgi:hypothetical protein